MRSASRRLLRPILPDSQNGDVTLDRRSCYFFCVPIAGTGLRAYCCCMASVAYYRAEAERCRALAAGTHDAEAATRWLRIARDYENLAKSLEAAPESVPPPVMHVPMQQQQPVQQQQAQTTPASNPAKPPEAP
jgi:hypothetical protein